MIPKIFSKGNGNFKGKIAASPDRWAIDGIVFEYGEDLYRIWFGWEGGTNV